MGQNRTLTEAARAARQVRGPMMKCIQCPTMFAPYLNSSAKFCSPKCNHASRPSAQKTPKPCGHCKAMFVPVKSMKAGFCSALCKGRQNKARTKLDPARALRAKETDKRRWGTERFRGSQADFKARRRSAEKAGTLTWAEWQAILVKFENRCAYCKASGVKLTRDHVVALGNGGAHVAGNIVPACGPCNSAKCDRDWTEKLSCP